MSREIRSDVSQKFRTEEDNTVVFSMPTYDLKLRLRSYQYRTLTFLYNYGSYGTYKTVSVREDGKTEEPPAPFVDGLTFRGWKEKEDGSGDSFVFGGNLVTDQILYADWTCDVTVDFGAVKGQALYLDGEDIFYADGTTDTKVINVNELNILGKHNYENVMAAVGMSVSFGVPMDKIVEVLKRFQAVEHRIEYVTEKRGVKFYNDSKGTNPDAAIQGIRAMNRPTLLIGGGYDKQSEYDEWIESFDGKVKKLVLIGQTKEKIAECAKKHGFEDVILCDTFEEAIDTCYANAVSGDAVLLSPACASWGMFANYEERGRIFKEYVRNLAE